MKMKKYKVGKMRTSARGRGVDMSPKTKKSLIIAAIVVAVVIALVVVGILIANSAKEKAHNAEIKELMISTRPNKTTYYVGDEPDYTGLTVQAISNDLSVKNLGVGDLTITGFNSESPVEGQVIVVRYGNHTTSFTVDIIPLPEEEGRLTHIELYSAPTKVTYTEAEWESCQRDNRMDLTGGIIACHYSNGEIIYPELTMYSIATPLSSISGVGEYTILVQYTEDGVTVTTTFTITITP